MRTPGVILLALILPEAALIQIPDQPPPDRAVFDRCNIVNEADLNSAVTRLAAFHEGMRSGGSDTLETHEAAGQT